MIRILIAGQVLTCTVYAFGCGGQVVVGGARPSDGGVESAEQQGEAGSPALDVSPTMQSDAGAAPVLQTAQTAMMAPDFFALQPGEEAFLCQVFENPFGRDVDLVSIEAIAPSQFTHDVFLFSLPPSGGVSVPPSPLAACAPDPLGLKPFLYFSDQQQFAMTYAQPDMGYPLSSSNSLLLRVHYVNPSTSLIQAQATFTLAAAMPGQVNTHVGVIFLSQAGLVTPTEAGPFLDQSFATPLAENYSIFTSWGFAVPGFAEVRASTSAGTFYDFTNSFTFAPLFPHDPPVAVGANETISWVCSYPNKDAPQNGRCVYQGYYYPADPQNPDRIVNY